MKIVCSNLAMRFYVQHGWTEDLIRSCLLKGELHFWKDDIFDGWDMRYWVPKVGATFDIDKLLALATDGIVRTYNDYPHETDKQFLTRFNW